MATCSRSSATTTIMPGRSGISRWVRSSSRGSLGDRHVTLMSASAQVSWMPVSNDLGIALAKTASPPACTAMAIARLTPSRPNASEKYARATSSTSRLRILRKSPRSTP
nr:putative toluene monooxygenase subunit A [uncultured bacterium]